MHKTDVAIIGGGFAGSLAAAMLGRAGIDCMLVDPHDTYPHDFRCEKLDGPQNDILEKTGLADAVRRASTLDGGCWIARYGRVIEQKPADQQGIMYADLVNTVRDEIPKSVPFIRAKARSVTAGADRQAVTLAGGEQIDARLVVLASGLGVSLRDSLGLKREIVSRCHSVAIGFTVKPSGQPKFAFPALTYYAEGPAAKTALLTMFPIGTGMRANLFVYRPLDDPWLQRMRAEPRQTLFALLPNLRRLVGDFAVEGRVEIRPIDLYVTHGHRQGGVVLVGDAFATSCPAAGTGAGKVLTDVERLCNHHLPQWLKTPGVGEAKIAAFYDDPVKRAFDDFAAKKAICLRNFSLDATPAGRAHRLVWFAGHAGRGALRAVLRSVAKPASGAAAQPPVVIKPAH
ncbi:MAG TPA: NAD(P)/FAD-dependent oxidoreductase [Xanthobacteraceae bacterium]|nr:NAD(P)/FAD-dependent oxidoreductase [Xanthobacteraceae bacterium]